MPANFVDFVMGDELLYKYKAVLDYAGHSITFRMPGRNVMVDLQE